MHQPVREEVDANGRTKKGDGGSDGGSVGDGDALGSFTLDACFKWGGHGENSIDPIGGANEGIVIGKVSGHDFDTSPSELLSSRGRDAAR